MNSRIKFKCFSCQSEAVNVIASLSKRIFSEGQYYILRCQTCSSTTTFPMPQLDLSYYENTFRVDDSSSHVDDFVLRYAKTLISQFRKITCSDPISILDVGCGNGDFLLALKAIGINALGIDPSTVMVSNCCKKEVSALKSSIEEFSRFSDYDLIILNSVLEHVENPQEIVSKIINSVPPSTIVVFQQAIYSGLVPMVFRKSWYGWAPNEHFFHWTKSGFIRFLSSINITPVKTITRDLYYCWTPFSLSGYKSYLFFNLQFVVSRVARYFALGDSGIFFIRGKKKI